MNGKRDAFGNILAYEKAKSKKLVLNKARKEDCRSGKHVKASVTPHKEKRSKRETKKSLKNVRGNKTIRSQRKLYRVSLFPLLSRFVFAVFHLKRIARFTTLASLSALAGNFKP